MGIVTNVRLHRVDGSIGVALPEELIEKLGVEAGDEMLMMESDGVIYLSPHDPHFEQAYSDYVRASDALHEAIRELNR